MGLKETYYSIEDKYYAFLDKVNAKIPIYKLIDKIDRVIPSMILFIIIIIGLIAGGTFLLLQQQSTPISKELNLTLIILDKNSNQPIENAVIRITGKGFEETKTTNSEGKALLKLNEKTELEISVKKNDYDDAKEKLLAEKSKIMVIKLVKKAIIENDKTVFFTDASGKKIIGKIITAKLTCSDSSAKFEKNELQTINGEITIEAKTIPKNCGKIQLQASIAGFDSIQKFLESDSDAFRFEERVITAKSRIEFSIKEKDTNKPIDEAEITLYDNENRLVTKSQSTNGNSLIEEIPIGKYYAVIEKSDYQDLQTEIFETKTSELKKISVELQKKGNSKIILQAIEKETKKPLEKAIIETITIDNRFFGRKETSSDGNATIEVLEGKYRIRARKDDYLDSLIEFEAKKGDNYLTMELEKTTPQNSGRIKVKVIDETGKPVQSAKVFLYQSEKETKTILLLPEPRFTDENGTAEFQGIREQEIIIFASKNFAEAYSKAITIKKAELNETELTITIGETELHLSAFDKDGKQIPEAKAEFMTDTLTGIGSILLTAQGETAYKIKADKSIFIKFTAQNHTPFTTSLIELKPKESIAIKAILEPKSTNGKIQLDFIGLFDSKNPAKEIKEIQAGNEYLLKWKLIVPEKSLDNENFSEIGIHLRTGKSEQAKSNLMENDNSYYTNLTPNRLMVKGTSFTPANGYETDQTNLTQENKFKWANAFLPTVSSSYEITAKIKIRENTAKGEEIRIDYRAWGKTTNGTIITTPTDESNGNTIERLLYAKTSTNKFFTAMPYNCPTTVCYSNEKLLDKEQNIMLQTQNQSDYSSIKTGNSYELSFELTNNSESILTNSQLFILPQNSSGEESKNIEFSGYEIETASGRKINASFPDGTAKPSKIEKIDIGEEWRKNSQVKAKLAFTVKNNETVILLIQIRADKAIQLEKEINIRTSAGKKMKIEYFPIKLFNFTAQQLEVSVKDNSKNEGIENAIARIKKKTGNSTIIIGTQNTNIDGNSVFTLPQLEPNSSAIIEAEKSNYETASAAISISQNIVSFTPDNLSLQLNPSNTTSEASATLQNNSQKTLMLKDIFFARNNSTINPNSNPWELLDEDAMNAHLRQLKSQKIQLSPNQQLENLKIFKGAIKTGMNFVPGRAKAILTTIFSDGTSDWIQTIPVEININFGINLANDNCLTINNFQWNTAVLSDAIPFEFTITNNCIDDKQNPMQLTNLKARIDWNGNAIGETKIKIENLTKPLNTRDNVLFSQIAEEQELNGTLFFNPLPQHLGETAKFNIIFTAEIPAQNRTQEILADKKIHAELLISNLTECISLSTNNIAMFPTESEKSFIITSSCPQTPIDIQLCENDRFCNGETAEGGIDNIPQDVFALNNSNPSKTITIKRMSIPGQYEIPLKARIPTKDWAELPTKTIKAIIQPESASNFSLERYEFYLPEPTTTDMTLLINNNYQRAFQVEASICDWDASIKKERSWEKSFVSGTVSAVSWTAILKGTGALAAIKVSLGPWGIVGITAAEFAVGALVSWIWGGDDPCKEKRTDYLLDYVINLSGKGPLQKEADAMPIELTMSSKNNGKIVPKGNGWLFEEQQSIAEIENDRIIEKIGVAFENKEANKNETLFGIAKIKAVKHSHDSIIKIPRKTDFAPFELPNTTETITEKIHLAFKTGTEKKETQQLFLPELSCSDGARQGSTSEKALPRIKLDWSWSNSTGITINSCDETNSDFIYCDAAQFSIELSKKLEAIEEFLAANSYSFACPLNPIEELAKQQALEAKSAALSDGNAGITKITPKTGSNWIEFEFEAENKTTSQQTIPITIEITPPIGANTTGYLLSQTKNIVIPANQTTKETIKIEKLEPAQNSNSFDFNVSTPNTNTIQGFTYSLRISLGETQSCWVPKTTKEINGKIAIEWFVNKEDPAIASLVKANVKWTDKVKNISDLRNLLNFNALLIKDGYSEDFQKDFADYYQNTSFFDTSSFFKQKAVNYFINTNAFKFIILGAGSKKLNAPGLYKANIAIEFADNWQLFNQLNKPKANIEIILRQLSLPEQDSLFYYLPFDGMVGLNRAEQKLDRTDYGIGYLNNQNPIKIIEAANQSIETSPSTISGGLMTIATSKEQEFKTLNTNKRGTLLSIETKADGTKELKITPSKPNPIALKHNSKKTNQTFKAYYYSTLNDKPQNTGSTQNNWTGIGANCKDFTGTPILQAIDNYPDTKETSNSQLSSQNAYSIEWPNSTKDGGVWLKTIIFTPTEQSAAIYSLDNETEFYSPISGTIGKQLSLPGIGIENKQINSLKGIFELVKQNKSCVMETKDTVEFYWNPKELYDYGAAGKSINELEKTLIPGTNCIE